MRFADFTREAGRRYAVIGLGQFGTALALGLAGEGAEVIALDHRAGPVERVREEVDLAVQCDATDVEALRAQDLAAMDAVIVAIGTDFEAALLISVELLDQGVERVLTRAYTPTQRRILQSVGVHEILAPEREMGARVARLLARPGLVDYLDLEDGYVVQEVRAPDSLTGQTLSDLDLIGRFEVVVVTIRRCADAATDGEGVPEEPRERHVFGVPTSATTIQEGDTLVLFGEREQIDTLLDDLG